MRLLLIEDDDTLRAELVAALAREGLVADALAAVEPADIAVRGTHYDMLLQLLLAAPRVAEKRRLTDSLGSWEREITSNAIEIYVTRLRAKLAGSGVLLRTVRGLGYRLERDGVALER